MNSRKAGILLFAFFMSTFLGNAFAQDKQNFRVAETGAIQVGDLQFRDLESYVGSEYFRERGGRCGTNQVALRRPALRSQQEARSPADCTFEITNILSEYQPQMLIEIPVWFHVISRTDGIGAVSDTDIAEQMQALNEDFRATAGSLGALGIDAKIEFKLAGITRTVNNEWYSDSLTDEIAYKQALVRDPTKYLNVYTNDAGGFLGYANFPFGSAGEYYDGVVMLSDTIGGRDNGFSAYDQGRTLVHEIGHYLGLFHTFEGGAACSNTFETGDLITDTNAESGPYYGSQFACNGRTTCGTPDPVENYMDYNVDSCMTGFTAQQVNRMICSLLNYRPGFMSVVDRKGNIVPILDLLLND